jgi:hypothetical protein
MSKAEFAKAKAIRLGQRDDQIPSTEEMTGWFQRVSVEKLRHIFRKVLAACVRRKVFDGDELLEFVKFVEKKYSDPNWMLRSKK